MSSRRVARLVTSLLVGLALLAGCSPTVEEMQREGDVDGLVDVLISQETAQVRAEAAEALGRLGAEGGPGSLAGAEAVDHLADALADADPVVRAAAAEGLAGLGDEDAVLPLLHALDDDDAEVRQAAGPGLVALLIGLGPSGAVAALDAAMQDEDDTVRASAARELGRLGADAAAIHLVEALADESKAVRDAASQALDALLDNLTDQDAVSILLDAVEDDRSTVRDAATSLTGTYLHAIGPERAVQALTIVGAGDAWLAIALGVSENDLATGLRRLGIQLESLDAITNAVAAVLDGAPVASARAWTASEAFHPAIVLMAGADSGDTSPLLALTERWAPPALRFVELAVVVDDLVWTELEVCTYYGPSITRYLARQHLSVIAVADGRLLSERTFAGTAPRECQATEPWDLTELWGETPDLNAAVEWVESLVNPPGG